MVGLRTKSERLLKGFGIFLVFIIQEVFGIHMYFLTEISMRLTKNLTEYYFKVELKNLNICLN